MSSAPLVLGADLTKLSDELVEIISNDEAISINQQWSGHPGALLRNISNNVQVWHKPQPNSTMAVLVINAQNSSVNATITLAELNMTGSCAVRDVWRHQDLGQATTAVTTEVGPTGSQFLLLAPLKTDDDDDAVSKIAASDPLVHWIGRTATGAEFGQSVLLMRSILIGKASRHLLTSRTTPGSRHRSATTVPAAPQAAARGGQSR